MNFQELNVVGLRGSNWRWQFVLKEEKIQEVRDFIKEYSVSKWAIHGNNLYVISIDDAYRIRMTFNDHIKSIKEAIKHPNKI